MKLHSPEFQTSLQSFAAQRDAQAEQLALAAETMHRSAVQDAAMALNQMADDYTTVGERFSTQLDPAVRNLKYAVQDTSRNIERMREQLTTELAASLAAVNMSSLIGDLVQALEEIEDEIKDDDPSESYEPSSPPVYGDDLYFSPTPAYSDLAIGATTETARTTEPATETGQGRHFGVEREIAMFYAQVRGKAIGNSLVHFATSAGDYLDEQTIERVITAITMTISLYGYGGVAVALYCTFVIIECGYGYYDSS